MKIERWFVLWSAGMLLVIGAIVAWRLVGVSGIVACVFAFAGLLLVFDAMAEL